MGEEHWYKEAIIYELHVKCFYDSSGDGIGDFKGLTQKLDYLQDLGVTAIWLLPFYPSPLKDDGYDIADYSNVHPFYGCLTDFKHFLREAHRRGLKVISELVLNHTSDQHLWFQRARNAPKGSKNRDFYVWSDTPDRYKEARIIFQDFETSNWAWDSVAQNYFWHRFYFHQPDLNFENPEVHQAVFRVLSFWLKMGVDGLRLDAVPYLYEREGTSCENLPETHAFLKKLRQFVDTHFKDRMLLAEANQWPEEAAEYFGKGDECHMAFHFPVMPRLFMSIQLEDTLPIIEIMGQTPLIPGNCQWALFLRNHDELTLEMVTDKERDYMFRVYAYDPVARLNLGIRRRLAPLLRNDRRKIELMNSLLFSLTGTPVIYYGDEIGMGDNIYLGDRDGVRTPMQWTNDRNAGFSRANPQQLYLPPIIDPEYHYETVNVEAQMNNPHSLLWWTKQLIALRKRFKAFSYGSTSFLFHENRKVLVFFREHEKELLMIVANFSRFSQYVELDLSKYNGYHLTEMFSSQRFPKIGELPYFLTLGPYGYYWFVLEPSTEESLFEKIDKEREKQFPEVVVRNGGDRIFLLRYRKALENIVKPYLFRRLWLQPYLLDVDSTRMRLSDHVALGPKTDAVHLVFIELNLTTGAQKKVPLFLKHLKGEEAAVKIKSSPESVVVKFKNPNNPEEVSILFDLLLDQKIPALLLDLVKQQKKIRSEEGELNGISFPLDQELSPLFALKGEQIGLHREEESIIFPNERGEVKIFSILDECMNLDVEMKLFLIEKTDFRHFLPLLGYVEYASKEAKVSLAEERPPHLKKFDAKKFTEAAAERFLMSLELIKGQISDDKLLPHKTWTKLTKEQIEPALFAVLGEHLEFTRLLGATTAQFHNAVASQMADPEFAPLGYTAFYQRSLYQTLRNKIREGLVQLRLTRPLGFEEPVQELLAKEEWILSKLQFLLTQKIHSMRIRCHGKYTLDNLLYTGKEFLIVDFSGDLNDPISERRYKRSGFTDCASMLLSLSETAFSAIETLKARGFVKEEFLNEAITGAHTWALWGGVSFLKAYLKELGQSILRPGTTKEIDFLLFLFLIEKSFDRLLEGEIYFPVLSLLQWLRLYEDFQM